MGWPCTKIPGIFRNSSENTLEVFYERFACGQNLRVLPDKYGFVLCTARQVIFIFKLLNQFVYLLHSPDKRLKSYNNV